MSGAGFGDVELALTGWIHTRYGVRAVTDLPGNLGGLLPIVQVARYAGSDSGVSMDRPSVDIDVYAADRGAAHDLAERLRAGFLWELPGLSVGGLVFARTQTISGPAWRPYDNTTLRRCGAAYQFDTRLLAAA